MDCWAVLGIDRTSDTAVVRKAYKQQLLVYHPEDDPAGYQKVREAYAAAMEAAKRLAKQVKARTEADGNTESVGNTQVEASTQTEAPADKVHRRLFKVESVGLSADDSEQGGDRKNEGRLTVKHHFFAEQAHQDKTQAENDFMARLEQLVNDHGKRNDPEAWKALLGDDVLWDIHSKSRIDVRMLRLFSEQHRNLDDSIWGIIEAHTGLFDKISRNTDEYPARFVDTYALATQKIAVPPRLKRARISAEQTVKKPEVSWWRYCLRIPIFWVVLLVIGNFMAIPLYLLLILVRIVLLTFRRNWKIIMWEYTFTYINRWGKRYDFNYVDIIKVVLLSNEVIIYLKGKRIRIKADSTLNVSRMLAKISRYGRREGDTFIMQD